jgi:hypothetical protein
VDLQLYARVLWRFRVLVAIGLAAAASLAFVSFFRVDPAASNMLAYRQAEEWVSYTRLLVTPGGFPWGRLVPAGNDPEAAEQGRLTSLAIIYSKLADGDAVRSIMRREGPIQGRVEIATLPAGQNSSEDLPIISIAAISDSPEAAKALARRQANAFGEYLVAEQRRSDIPPNQRVKLEVVNDAKTAELMTGRSKTLPIVVFMTVMFAVIALAFLLENLLPAPRVRSVAGTSATGKVEAA